MYRYSRSLNAVQMRRDLRRVDRFAFLSRFWSRWGDPLLAGVLLALMAWAILHGYTR
jgi:uncharacterized RDD family membrane protein YckC